MDALKILREKSGNTQQEMADILKIDRITYHRYEKGIREPSLEVLIRIADYFDVSIDYLLGRTDSPEPIIKEAAARPAPDATDITLDMLEAQVDVIRIQLDKFREQRERQGHE